MGLLTVGTPLEWKKTKTHADHVRKHGILQFINQYKKLKGRSKDCLLWGDEIEYMLVRLDPIKKKPLLVLDAERILNILMEEEAKNPLECQTTWRPEYGSYMVEGTPGRPYGPRMTHFNIVEANMKRRRDEVMKLLSHDPNIFAMTLTSFPRLGCGEFTIPRGVPDPINGVSQSMFFPDEAIFQGHPRFRTLSRNIRERRGEKPAINVPIYHDQLTRRPFVENHEETLSFIFPGVNEGGSPDNQSKKETASRTGFQGAKEDHIYMDCMGFGMGCCCLQVTFQACNIGEARLLYDQLAPLCPIMLALSASSPIYRGHLSELDCRWSVISASVDDRTEEERGIKPLKNERYVIPKSRYDSIDSYLSADNDKYNDIELVLDEDIRKMLLDEGIDNQLARHIAHLFIRDPISVFAEKLDLDDEVDTDHFENIQSTNWQTMRFKPPPPNTDIGWRVEFRPMEVQLTDFENAAYVVFIVLLTRVILSLGLNFVIPISKVDENMWTAQKRDACRKGKFYFRKNISTCNTPKGAKNVCHFSSNKKLPTESGESVAGKTCPVEEEYGLFTIQEIISGKPGEFPGLRPLIDYYLQNVDDCDVDTSCTISQYLNLIEKRASGKLVTTATWMRDFVSSHRDYKRDSVVPDSTAYDLLKTCADITFEGLQVPNLIARYMSKTREDVPDAMTKMDELHADMAARRDTGVGDVNMTH